MRPGDTPVPIPNTTVKTRTADGTMLETAWESRWLPDCKKKYSRITKSGMEKFYGDWTSQKTGGCSDCKTVSGKESTAAYLENCTLNCLK